MRPCFAGKVTVAVAAVPVVRPLPAVPAAVPETAGGAVAAAVAVAAVAAEADAAAVRNKISDHPIAGEAIGFCPSC